MPSFSNYAEGSCKGMFSRLTPNSISIFKEFRAQFASHFIRGHRYKKSTTRLINIK